MKARKYEWFDLSTNTPMYGIQVYHNGKWMNCIHDGVAMIFKTEKERDENLKLVRKM